MAKIDLIMPKMGESIIEATILNWVKNVGDTVEMDETILEIATDKVDSEVPSPVSGTIIEILYNVDDVVAVGEVVAVIATEGESPVKASPAVKETVETKSAPDNKIEVPAPAPTPISSPAQEVVSSSNNAEGRFYSPLVKSIAKEENISITELDAIVGSGNNGRVTKKDILSYIENRSTAPAVTKAALVKTTTAPTKQATAPTTNHGGNVEIIEMDRMRKLIADHMVMSKHTSPHVTSFVEVDVTEIVNWRNKVKNKFIEKYGQKITFTPIFMEAIIKAMKDFPLINVSVEGKNIIKKNDLNLGMATALPSGNLIVPVIKNADSLNLLGLVKAVNGLATKARSNKLSPDDIQGGTFTVTNVGTFGNVMGTPIINQPQVAILALGAVRKKPAVLETEYGDIIAVRHMMFLSLSYDHRVVDGFLGGSFLRRIGDYMEQFDSNTEI